MTDTNYLREKILLFLYAISITRNSINKNTFERFLYLYYMSSKFLYQSKDSISVILKKSGISINGLAQVLDDLVIGNFILLSEDEIIINNKFTQFFSPIMEDSEGKLNSDYKTILPFINLLCSYSDDNIFTIMFSEPTFISADLRNSKQASAIDSQLSILLTDFKKSIVDKEIDEYDILTYWMDYILKSLITSGEASEWLTINLSQRKT